MKLSDLEIKFIVLETYINALFHIEDERKEAMSGLNTIMDYARKSNEHPL